MSLEVIVVENHKRVSDVAADILMPEMVAATRNQRKIFHLGLPTGTSPRELKDIIVTRQEEPDGNLMIGSNPDEYVGLPGNTPAERASHPRSYATEMNNFYSRLNPSWRTHIPPGAEIDINLLFQALAEANGEVKMVGNQSGKAVDLSKSQHPYLKEIKRRFLDGHVEAITEKGPIDWQVLGVGRNGHIGFHESGIPLDYRMMLVRLDEQTRKDAFNEGHFASQEEVPQYALTLGAMGIVHFCRNVLFIGSGDKRTDAVARSLLDDISLNMPLSVLQHFRHYDQAYKRAIYDIDEIAAAEILKDPKKLEAKGIKFTDMR